MSNHFVFACLLSRQCSAAFSGLWLEKFGDASGDWTEVAPKQGIVHTVGNWGRMYPVSWKRVVSSVHRCILKHPPWKLNMTEVLYTKGRHGTCGVPTSYTTLSCKLPPSRMRSGDKSVAKYSVSQSVSQSVSKSIHCQANKKIRPTVSQVLTVHWNYWGNTTGSGHIQMFVIINIVQTNSSKWHHHLFMYLYLVQ